MLVFCNIKVTSDPRGVLIENMSEDHRLIIYLVPEAPKRRWIKIHVIEPTYFKLFDYNVPELDNFAYVFEKVISI